MQKQIVLVLTILLSTAIAQFSENNPLNDFLSRCANGQIAQGYSLACQIVQRSSILYRLKEGSGLDTQLVLPSNAGIKRHLKAKGISLKELQKSSVSISFAQAHLFVYWNNQKLISMNGNLIDLNYLIPTKMTVNNKEIAIWGKEDKPIWGAYIFYIDNPLEFLDREATANSFPVPEVSYQIKGEDLKKLPIFAIVDQCAKALILPEYSLSCQAIQNSGLLLRSQTSATCYGIRLALLPNNQSLERVLKEKTITSEAFIVGILGKKFAGVHLGCLPSVDDTPNIISYIYMPFANWFENMAFSNSWNYKLEVSERGNAGNLETSLFSPTSEDAIRSKQLNGVAAQLLPYSIQTRYKSYLRCEYLCEYLLLDKPLPF